MTATIGTIPALPQYQPGALPITGQEILEIASSANATSAASYYMKLTDIVGKAPSAMAGAQPVADDLVVFFQAKSGLPFASLVGNLSVPAGNFPAGGTAGQILVKNSATSYDASWTAIVSQIVASTGLFVAGSTTISVGVATGGVGTPQIATHAVGNAQFRQGAALSVVGVAGNATADVADIAASGGLQVLQTNTAGTGLVFGSLNPLALPGPYQTGTLTQYGLVYGNGTSKVGTINATTAGLVVIANNATTLPSYQQINLGTTSSLTGTLLFALGGLGTSNLTLNGVLLGNGTTTPKITAAPGTGTLLAGSGTTNAPTFTTTPVIGGATVTSFLQFAGQTSGVINVMAQQAAGTFNFNFPTTAGTAGQALISQGGLTSAMTWTGVASGTGWGLTGANATSFSPSIATANPPYGFDAPVNLGLTASVLTGVLTVNFLANNGAAATAGNPILVGFRNTNATSGLLGWAVVTSSLTISTIVGASFGAASSSSPFRLWATLFYQNATSVIPALINCSNTTQIYQLNEGVLATTVAMTSTATLAGTFYSPSGTTALNAPYRIVGYVEYANGLATAGTFSTAPTAIQLFGPGIKKPGDVVQCVQSFTTTDFTTSSTTFATTTVTQNFTPTSAANLVMVESNGNLQLNATSQTATVQIFRNATAIGAQIAASVLTGPAQTIMPSPVSFLDAPGTSASIAYSVQLKTNTSTASYPSARGGYIILREIMG